MEKDITHYPQRHKYFISGVCPYKWQFPSIFASYLINQTQICKCLGHSHTWSQSGISTKLDLYLALYCPPTKSFFIFQTFSNNFLCFVFCTFCADQPFYPTINSTNEWQIRMMQKKDCSRKGGKVQVCFMTTILVGHSSAQ